jgi:flagellar basal-body rod protein FlgF
MSQLLSTIMSGARQVMKAQSVNANNLANASTDGFRAELVHIASLDAASGISGSVDFTPGQVRTTGRSLDIGIAGEGWIAIQTADGSEGYTRRGDLHVNEFGQLLTGAGQAVLGEGGPIALPPHSSIEIGSDGSITIRPQRGAANALVVAERIKLVNPEARDLYRGDDGIIRHREGLVADADPTVRVQSGTLEGSNVNAVAEMLKMIDLARQFEAQVKLMQDSEDNSDSLSSILRLNS